MTIRAEQLRNFVVGPALHRLGLRTPEAEELVLGTAAQESHFQYIDQLDRGEMRWGPAYGLWQMEAATHRDIWERYLNRRPDLRRALIKMLAPEPRPVIQLATNLLYGAAMCRVFYRRKPGRIPVTLLDQARYWKKHYNTHLGAGTVAQYMDNYRRLVDPDRV